MRGEERRGEERRRDETRGNETRGNETRGDERVSDVQNIRRQGIGAKDTEKTMSRCTLILGK